MKSYRDFPSARARSLAGWVLLAVVADSACMFYPTNEQILASEASAVTFSGYVTAPSATVVLQSAIDPNEPFSTIATTTASSRAIRFAGIEVYSFSTNAVIPQWSATAGCGDQQAFVRGRTGIANLITFDHPSVSGQLPFFCITDEITAGSDLIEALAECQSPQSPIVRLRAPSGFATVHEGDVTIATQTEADALACVHTIEGSLTVTESLEDISLPSLEIVHGDVSLTYPRPDGDVVTTRTIELPALTTIEGSLSLSTAGGSQIVSMPLGMGSLTSIAGNIDVSVAAFNITFSGLAALTNLAGNLTIVTGNGDTSGNSFLANLVTVGGDVHLDLGHTVTGMLRNLETVDGSFALLDGNPTTSNFDALTTVGQDLTFANASINAAPTDHVFESLSSVAGTLVYDAIASDDLQLGSPALGVGAIAVQNNPNLDVVGAEHISVIGSGDIAIVDNPNLSTCDAQDWVDSQIGWSGTAILSGNGPC